jgi:uncharacterized protein YpmS
MTDATAETEPGFNIWPWVPVIILAVAVAANAVFITLAIQNAPERVDRVSEPAG